MSGYRFRRRLLMPILGMLVVLLGTMPDRPARAQEAGLRRSFEIDPSHLALASRPDVEERAVLRLEWKATQSRIRESETLERMLKRLANIEETTRELFQLLNAMPTPVKTALATPVAASPPRPTAPTPTEAATASGNPPAVETTRQQGTPNADAESGLAFGASLPLSVKLIGAVILLLALSLAAYRWLLADTRKI